MQSREAESQGHFRGSHCAPGGRAEGERPHRVTVGGPDRAPRSPLAWMEGPQYPLGVGVWLRGAQNERSDGLDTLRPGCGEIDALGTKHWEPA